LRRIEAIPRYPPTACCVGYSLFAWQTNPFFI